MNAGQLTTFYRLINEESMIIIPKVQRDYAYGRLDDKAPAILDNILNSMLTALQNNRQEIFDFVYGGAYEKNGLRHAGMIPLDGQQRLTTLFLLHFYASITEKVATDEIKILGRFRYETRQSANEFGQNLIGPIRENILRRYKPGINICDIIKDDALYSPAYAADPTISSMLVALSAIEQKFRWFRKSRFRRNSIGLWTALTKRDNLCFYHITLDKLGLTDDLYIKMNSRGKKLTQFEIFKADLESHIKSIDKTRAEIIVRKIDTEWIDMVWNNFRGEPSKTDEAYMILLNNVLRLMCFWIKSIVPSDEKKLLATALTTSDDIDLLCDILSKMYDVNKRDFIKDWGKIFYHAPASEHIIGQTDRIRLFGQGAYAGNCIYLVAMSHRMSNPELVQLLASYLVEKSKLSSDKTLMTLRIIRNLITANQRANDFRAKDMPGFLCDVERIVNNILSDVYALPSNMTFTSTAVDEERRKFSLSRQDYEKLLEYENHYVLNGSIGLFMDNYHSSQILIDSLEHFKKVFDDDCMTPDGFEKIRINLLDSNIDYCQWEAGDEQGSDTRKRFIHTPKDYTEFLKSNIRRRNQNAIIHIIASLPEASQLRCNNIKCRDFTHSDYRYYMAKYYASNSTETKYGYYGWHDIHARPLDAYILNSSYFGTTNLAWSMMLHILHDQFYRHPIHSGNMSWDQHQAPLHFTKIDIVAEFHTNHWIFTTSTKATIDRLRSISRLVPINSYTESNYTKYIIYANPTSRPDLIACATCVINAVSNRFTLMPRGWNCNRFAMVKRH